MNDEMFTIPRAAEHCGVSRWTIWKCVKAGTLKASLTPGGHHRILKKDLEAFARKKGMYPLGNYQPPKKNKILIVDDDREIREMLTRMLRIHKYETDTASDGFEAGAKVERLKPDLIILDLFMPGMDGFEVCRRLKEDPGSADLKILILTGYDSNQNRERIMAQGADDYLVKPVDNNIFFRHVESLLNNGQVAEKARPGG
ncbi:MAG: response regulator, partial [Desulfobacteraceae bacterium]|nr:response regulator [Desulfobacteraceae bacterium]